jgi:hypothetical protein
MRDRYRDFDDFDDRPRLRQSESRSFFVRHPTLSVFGILSVLCFLSCAGCCGFAYHTGSKANEEDRKRMAAAKKEKEAADAKATQEHKDACADLFHADRLWVAGQKQEAVKTYRKILDRKIAGVPGDNHLATIHGRYVEWELIEGDKIAARRAAEKAIDAGIDPTPERKDARDVVRSVRVERAVLADALRQQKEEERKRKEEQDRIAQARDEKERMEREQEAAIAASRAKAERKWHEGGTLQRARMRDWRRAEYRDKLATSADVVVAILKAEGTQVRRGGAREEAAFRRAAEAFVAALDEVNKAGELDDETVAAMAAAIYVVGKLRYETGK